ncbi:MAG: ribosome assembly RNA-binding protein YhbY [Erysipelotrichaceae bacterium]|jgi:RNA-binding protein|nr:ribosome assembly RNA-binding protein YhbY [Bacillota bacterium]NLP22808.1 ribosome assembly RNA-binding protein YhbY [Erysipelotrichaceae bacterium]HCY07127.1 ribosome assembly RNA-binding protein YhbY [Erysipelotrichaceae bacterium]
MILTGKQKRYLRSLGVNEKAVVTVGKEGLSTNLIDSLNNALNARELVKVNVLKSYEDDLDTLAFDIAMHTKSSVVQQMGRTILLYKKARNPKIILP